MGDPGPRIGCMRVNSVTVPRALRLCTRTQMCHNETEARAERGAVGAGGNRSGDSGWDGSRERQWSE